MNLWFRLLYTLLAAPFRRRVDPLGPCRTAFRVWPTDLDALGHMTNSKYLAWLDLARLDLMLRSRLAGELRRRGWYPVVANQTIAYRRALNLFARVEVETSILGWDDRCLYLEQRFLAGGEVAAHAIVRGRFLKVGGGKVPVADLLTLAGAEADARTLPAWVQDWATRLR